MQLAHVGLDPLDRGIKRRQLGVDIGRVDLTVRHRIEIGPRIHHPGDTKGDPRRTRQPFEPLHLAVLAVAYADIATDLGMGDAAGKLPGDGHQKGDLVLGKQPLDPPLHHQHPEHIAMMDDGDAQIAREWLLTAALDIEEARVGRGLVQIDRLGTLAHHRHQPLTGAQPHLPLGFAIEPLGGHQHQRVVGRVVQIDGADIGIHRAADIVDDNPQHRIEVTCGTDALNNAAQDRQHGAPRLNVVCAGDDSVGGIPAASPWTAPAVPTRAARRSTPCA